MKKTLKLIILCFIFGLLLYGQNAFAACPAKPAGCTATDCYTGGYCGCDKSTTSEYSCMDKSNGTNCVANLCPGGANTQCCKAKAAGGGTAAGGGGAATSGTVTLGEVSPVGNLTGASGIATLIGKIINAFLGFIGAVALLMFVYGGFLMLVSGGKPEEINKGKNVLVWAVIGLIVVFMSYTLTKFVIGGITSGVTSIAGGGSTSCLQPKSCKSILAKSGCQAGLTDTTAQTGCAAVYEDATGESCDYLLCPGQPWYTLCCGIPAGQVAPSKACLDLHPGNFQCVSQGADCSSFGTDWSKDSSATSCGGDPNSVCCYNTSPAAPTPGVPCSIFTDGACNSYCSGKANCYATCTTATACLAYPTSFMESLTECGTSTPYCCCYTTTRAASPSTFDCETEGGGRCKPSCSGDEEPLSGSNCTSPNIKCCKKTTQSPSPPPASCSGQCTVSGTTYENSSCMPSGDCGVGKGNNGTSGCEQYPGTVCCCYH